MTRPLAILCSDLHLSQRAPTARSAEPDWFAAMARPLAQLRGWQKQYNVPVVCAGDIFDRWNSPPELINFAIEHLPHMYAIPGQHDLANHNLGEIERTAYWTLVQAGKITPIAVGEVQNIWAELCVVGFPWGVEPEPLTLKPRGFMLAVCHRYVWSDHSTAYPGAPEEAHATEVIKQLRGYHATVFGDNHKGFWSTKTKVYNCGTMMRRKLDERGYAPRAYLLKDDGQIRTLEYDTSHDMWVAETEAVRRDDGGLDLAGFIDGLQALGSGRLDFTDALREYLDRSDVGAEVRTMALEAACGPAGQ
jgi:hypothetical protein